jgi:hypothetical protein
MAKMKPPMRPEMKPGTYWNGERYVEPDDPAWRWAEYRHAVRDNSSVIGQLCVVQTLGPAQVGVVERVHGSSVVLTQASSISDIDAHELALKAPYLSESISSPRVTMAIVLQAIAVIPCSATARGSLTARYGSYDLGEDEL